MKILLSCGSALLLALSSYATEKNRLTPLGFIPNVGQLANPHARFSIRGEGVTGYLTETGFVLWNGRTTSVSRDGLTIETPVAPRWSMLGARPVQPRGGLTYPHTVSYFRGSESAQWHPNVPAYQEVRYPEIQDGVELRFAARPHGFEYSFYVQPRAQANLHFKYDGIVRLESSPTGDLRVHTAQGYFTEQKPLSFQLINGEKRLVASSFEILSANEYRIVLGPYDHAHELVIDPVLDWSTFWGGSHIENSRTLKVDAQGNIIAAGLSVSLDLPNSAGFSTGPGLTTVGTTVYNDAYVLKFKPDGTQLIWAGYLAGAGATRDECGWKGLAVDPLGDVYVSGATASPDFPVTGTSSFGGVEDAFITRIKADGSDLVWSRFFGGSDEDRGVALALDGSGALYAAGETRSLNLPVTGSTFAGVKDAYVAKLNAADGSSLWARYLGGASDEHLIGLVATPGGPVASGDTSSADFPTTPGSFDRSLGGPNDAFVSKFAADGSALLWSTYLGGSDKEQDLREFPDNWAKGDLCLDNAGNLVIVGQTFSSDFPVTPGAFQTSRRGNDDGFVTKLLPNGSGLVWSSYLGGTGPSDPLGREEIAWGVTVNPWDELIVVGWSQSTDFPTTSDALQRTASSVRYDGFVTKFRANGSSLLYSTYLGGYNNNDVALAVTYDSGHIFTTGWASAANFPTTGGAYQEACASCLTDGLWASDGYVTKFLDAFLAFDGFESASYSGGTGWSGAWTASGDVSLLTSATPHSGTRHVRLRRGTGLLARNFSVPPGTLSLQLGFWSRVQSFESGDRADIIITATGFPTLTQSLNSTHSDDRWHYYQIDLSTFASASQIRLTFDAAMSAIDDNWHLDDVRLTGTQDPDFNQPPIAQAGPDQSVTDNDNNGVETVLLNGAASSDPDGTILSYLWQEGAVTLGTGPTLSRSFTVGIHTVTLTVTDNDGALSSDTLTIEVKKKKGR